MEPLPQSNLKSFPRRVQSVSPVDSGSLSPVDSGSLSPAECERSPGFIQKVISSPELITGLSSSNCHRKIVPGEVLPIPSKIHQIFQQSSTMVSPAELSSISAKYLSSHIVLFPSKIARIISPRRVISKFIPQRSHLLLPVFLQSVSPVEMKNATLQHQVQDLTSRHPSRIYFPRQKHTFINIASSYIIACIYAS